MADETTHPRSNHNFFLSCGLFGLLLVVVFILTAPLLLRSRKRADHTPAVNNARNIGLALRDFELSYGILPNDSTSRQVTARTSSTLPLGSKYSNDYFRQLIAAEIIQSEDIFYANIPGSLKPDNHITDSKALEKGECSFSYLIGATKDSPLGTPLVVAPLLQGKTLFDYKAAKKPFSGRAVFLSNDGTVQVPLIDKSGHALINGKDLFDPTQPFWNGKAPIIKWPDL